VLEDFESFSLKPFAQQTRKAPVVHAAAGENDLADSCCFVRQGRGAHESMGDARMKTRCDMRLGDARAQIGEELAP
jgi:hypothetical protein